MLRPPKPCSDSLARRARVHKRTETSTQEDKDDSINLKVHAVKAIINCDWCTVRHVLRAMVFREWKLTGKKCSFLMLTGTERCPERA